MPSEENIIQKKGMDLCKEHALVSEIYRTQSGKVKVRGGWMQLCPAGTPDTTGFTIDGRIIGIEYKTPLEFDTKDHGASKDQLNHLNKIKSSGGVAGIAASMDHVNAILQGEYIGLE
ncbi:MAG: hypothetical protein V7765_21625 [Oleispira sp.]